jgi:hypothetical protein
VWLGRIGLYRGIFAELTKGSVKSISGGVGGKLNIEDKKNVNSYKLDSWLFTFSGPPDRRAIEVLEYLLSTMAQSWEICKFCLEHFQLKKMPLNPVA